MLLDLTGLQGFYDFDLDWAADETQFGGRPGPGTDSVDAPSIFDALKELGLKLDAPKGRVDVMVIDHIERPTPS